LRRLAVVAVLRALNGAVKDLDRSVAAHLGEHPDGPIFTSLPRSGQINAAQMLAEWGDCRQAYDGPDSVAALAGVTPVTRQSGKYRGVEFRWACNKRFRRAVTAFAGNSRHARPWAARSDLRRSPRRRQGPPARHPHPGPRLDLRHLALLGQRHTLRPRQARRSSHPRQPNSQPICRLRLTQGVSWRVPW
jgi:Transposase IS116/IS110/IS902 family